MGGGIGGGGRGDRGRDGGGGGREGGGRGGRGRDGGEGEGWGEGYALLYRCKIGMFQDQITQHTGNTKI